MVALVHACHARAHTDVKVGIARASGTGFNQLPALAWCTSCRKPADLCCNPCSAKAVGDTWQFGNGYWTRVEVLELGEQCPEPWADLAQPQ